MEYIELGAEDDLFYDIMQHRAKVSAVVQRCAAVGGVCLMHCHAGINRSAVLAIAELMLSERLPLITAVDRCRRARGQLLWNHAFQVSLVRLAREEALLGEPPGAGASGAPASA